MKSFSWPAAIEEYPEEILALAEKYEVNALKARCELTLWGRLDDQNLCTMLVFAETYKYVGIFEKKVF